MKDRLDNLKYIISFLKNENPDFSDIQTPSGLQERQLLMRALLNVRPPAPLSEDFLKAQDEELRSQREDKGTVKIDEPGLRLWQGDITRLDVDAIVNAANSAMLGCFVPLHGCIDNAIHSAAGAQLRLECDRIMRELGREAYTGEAIITPGYNLPAKWVIHTVGPIIRYGRPTKIQEKELADCYVNCLSLADKKGLRSIAFCCISTGVFSFPHRRAAEIAVETVRKWLASHTSSSIKTVIFNVFKDEDCSCYKDILNG